MPWLDFIVTVLCSEPGMGSQGPLEVSGSSVKMVDVRAGPNVTTSSLLGSNLIKLGNAVVLSAESPVPNVTTSSLLGSSSIKLGNAVVLSAESPVPNVTTSSLLGSSSIKLGSAVVLSAESPVPNVTTSSLLGSSSIKLGNAVVLSPETRSVGKDGDGGLRSAKNVTRLSIVELRGPLVVCGTFVSTEGRVASSTFSISKTGPSKESVVLDSDALEDSTGGTVVSRIFKSAVAIVSKSSNI
ncbi:hypothetical protein EGW08_013675 [Elysia chlorotica]|uniref:Uncharacterized protein n=1 Tax=Elysia chlorotica TaxID=188477 RepID=A0A3S0ZIH2_ELYCH|nr:hypothetical protein EGW08_013675 [Elysia chlorotica]